MLSNEQPPSAVRLQQYYARLTDQVRAPARLPATTAATMRRAARPLSTNRTRSLACSMVLCSTPTSACPGDCASWKLGSDAGVRRRPAWQRTKSHSHARHSAGESYLYGGAPGAALHCLRLLLDAATLRTEPAPLALAGVGAGHREPREDDLLRSLPRICRIAGASLARCFGPLPRLCFRIAWWPWQAMQLDLQTRERTRQEALRSV